MTTKRTVQRTITVPIEVEVNVTVEWTDEPGVWRTANGDGCPPSSYPSLKDWTHNSKQVELDVIDAIGCAIDDGKLDE